MTASLTAVSPPAVDGDAELLTRLRAGDEAAFAALVRRHQAGLLRLARSIVGNQAVAEEAVQETWLAVVRGVENFEGRSTFKTWLFRILVNRARREGAREHRSDPIGAPTDDSRFDAGGAWAEPPVAWSDRVDDRLVAEELAIRVREVLPTLPEVQRQVVVLRDVEGLTAAEVVELLGISHGNQRVLLHRARGRIRDALELQIGGR